MDPCSEVMRFFKEAEDNGLDVRFANFDVHGMRAVDPFCSLVGKRVLLSFQTQTPGFFGFQCFGQEHLELDASKVKVVPVTGSANNEQFVMRNNTEIFKSCKFPWWKYIWG